MTAPVRCAIYTRKSTEEGLDQAFNSLDAQREACEAYIASQRHEGWQCLTERYDDGGHSGGTMERPALKRLLADVAASEVDVIILYKIDRLTRALSDFARIVEVLDRAGASFVSVTQAFNTTTSMGRLTLNVLLSFAQFEREVGAERVRDKIAASKKKGMWMGGVCPLGFDVDNRRLVVNDAEAATVREIFELYVELGSVIQLEQELRRRGIQSKQRRSRNGAVTGGKSFTRGAIYALLRNVIYIGRVRHRSETYDGEQPAIISGDLFDRAQVMLDGNQVARRSMGGVRGGSWLAGLLWDDKGRRMSPSHTCKGSKRYRYYQSRLDLGSEEFGPAVRVPAQEIEDLVLTELQSLVADARTIHDHFQHLDAPAIARAIDAGTAVGRALSSTVLADRAGTARALLRRVEVQVTSILLKGSLSSLVPEVPTCADFQLKVPATVARRSNEVRLVIPPAQAVRPCYDPGLMKLVVRAHQVRKAFESCEAMSLAELAGRMELNLDYLTVLLKLSYLPWDLGDAILRGQQPRDLDRQFLARIRALPFCWAEQRRKVHSNPSAFS